MIKWEHSFLTLPFGLTGAVLAAEGIPPLRTLLWICVALVAARSAAMAFNRIADAEIDAGNPRTATRAIPAGHLSRGFVFWFVVITSAILILAAWMLNPLSFYLSPVALAIVFAYSYTKRFTRWAHLALGLAMGIAPAAAWVAVRGSFDPRILIVTAAVMFWGGGFDVSIAARIMTTIAGKDCSRSQQVRYSKRAEAVETVSCDRVRDVRVDVYGVSSWADGDVRRARGRSAARLRTLAG